MMEIKLTKEQSLKGYTLLETFPGIGLVGPMAGSYIIEKLSMEYIGHIESDLFPPIAAIHNTLPMFPARIYRNEKYKIILFISEFTISPSAVYQLSNEILAFARKYGIAKIISVEGMPSQKPSEKIYITATDPEVIRSAGKFGIKPIQDGVVAGVSASILIKATEYKIPTIDILVEVNPLIMDPKYAVIAITGLNKILNIDIDLSELDKEAKDVDTKIRELQKKVKDSHDHYASGAQEMGPSMYA